MPKLRSGGGRGATAYLSSGRNLVVELYDWRPGGASLHLRMGESGGSLPEAAEDRSKLAAVLKREVAKALDELLLS